MRHAGMIFALLAAGTQLTACATAGSPGALQGQAGVVAWEIVDTKQTLEENGFRMRWDFTLVFKNTGEIAIDFERVEHGSRAGGPVDGIVGGLATAPFAHRLEPGGEFRISQNESWGCPQCGPGRLPRIFSDGIIVYYTLLGHDAGGVACGYPSPSASTAASGSASRERPERASPLSTSSATPRRRRSPRDPLPSDPGA